MFRIVLILVYLVFSSILYATNIPLNQHYTDYTPQNSGKTGIIEMPNARVMDDWRIRGNFSYNNPFVYYGMALSPLPRLEMNFRMTQIQGVPGFTPEDAYGDYKDKAIDIKFLLSREDEVWPAIVLGVDDITGTALYSSKYIALSKRVRYLDLTAGYAIGRMGGYNVSEYVSLNSADRAMDFLASTELKGSPFFGLEAHVTPELVIKAEYSPVDYQKDKANAFKAGLAEEPSSHFNYGISYAISDKLNLSANFERGNSFSIGVNMQFPFAKEGLYPHEPDPRWRASQKVKSDYTQKSEDDLSQSLANEVAAEKLSNVDVALHKNKLWVSLENPRYNSDVQALGRAADTIDEVVPEQYDTLYLALKYRNFEHSVIKVDRQELKEMKRHFVSDEEMKRNIEVYSSPQKAYEEFSEGDVLKKTDTIGGKSFVFVHRPHLQTFLNAKDNPFVYRFTWLAGYRWFPWDGAMIQQRMRIPLLSTMDEIADKTLEPEALATRTDVLKYQQYDKIQMNDFSFDQILSLPFESLGRVSLGYFEAAYVGYGAEWYKPLSNGHYGIGIEYQKVHKREIDDFFGIKDQEFDAKFINFYAELYPELGISATLKVGQFLAGDTGYKLSLSRTFKGFTIGAYIAKTDTSIFTSQENKDYIDKGIFISIPLSTVTNKNVQGNLHYGLSAWTRDVAQVATQPSSLVGTGLHNSFKLQSNIEEFKD